MAKLTNLRLNEFSVVRGADVQPANPGAVAHVYKATPKEQDDVTIQKTEPTAQGQPKLKTLAERIGEAVRGVVKGQQTREVQSNSTYVETFNDGQPDGTADQQQPIVVVVQDSAPAAAPPIAKATPAADPVPDTAEIIKAALAEALNPFSERLAKLEKAPVGSAVIRKYAGGSGVQVADRGMFPGFSKFLAEKAGLSPGQKISKATITSASLGSYGLSFEESGAFLDYVIDESVVLKNIRTVKMKNQRQPIDKIGLGSTVMVKSVVGVDPGDTTSVTTSQVMLQSQDCMAVINIGDDTLQDNIEGDEFVQHLLGMVSRAAANEIEAASILGDSTLAVTGIMNMWDGFYKLAKANGAHVIEGMADTDRYWAGANGAKMTKLLKALPTKYRRDKAMMRNLIHPDLYLDYTDTLTGISSVPGFAAITGGADVPIRGVQHLQAPGISESMAFTYSSTNYTNGTFVMLTNPQNLIVGIHQDITLEPFREPVKRQTRWAMVLRQDVKIENADAIAIYDHALVH
jgi:hypothetical protein